MGDTGLEHPAKTPGKTGDFEPSGAESGAVADRIDPIDPDLQRVIEAWPSLTEQVRAGILTTIDAATVR